MFLCCLGVYINIYVFSDEIFSFKKSLTFSKPNSIFWDLTQTVLILRSILSFHEAAVTVSTQTEQQITLPHFSER